MPGKPDCQTLEDDGDERSRRGSERAGEWITSHRIGA
jgi:hypothetical protein